MTDLGDHLILVLNQINLKHKTNIQLRSTPIAYLGEKFYPLLCYYGVPDKSTFQQELKSYGYNVLIVETFLPSWGSPYFIKVTEEQEKQNLIQKEKWDKIKNFINNPLLKKTILYILCIFILTMFYFKI